MRIKAPGVFKDMLDSDIAVSCSLTQLAALLDGKWVALTPLSLPAAEGPQCPQRPSGLSYLVPVGVGLGDAEGGRLCFVGLGYFFFFVSFCL